MQAVIMNCSAKSFALMFAVLCLISIITIIPCKASSNSGIQSANGNSVPPSIEWQQEVKSGSTESVSKIVQTSDGGYAFLDLGYGHQGYRTSTFYKLNSTGNVQSRIHDNSIWARSMVQTNDGDIEMFGSWESGGDFWFGSQKETLAVFKMDPDGNIKSVVNSSAYGSTPLPTSDGGFIIKGVKGNLTKINSLGIKQWTNIYSASANHSDITSIIQTSDMGYALVGSTSFNGTSNTPNLYIWLAKLDAYGNLQWTRQFGDGPATVDTNQTQNAGALDGLNRRTLGDNEGVSLVETSDGGFVVTGIIFPLRNYSWWGFSYEPNPNMAQSFLVKTDSQGNQQWNRTFIGIETSPIIQTSDNGLAFATDGYIVKTDSTGYLQWVINVTFPSIGRVPNPLGLSYLLETSDGSLVGLGVGTNGEPWLGNIYLIKTVAFLPLPSPIQLPPPIPSISSGALLITPQTLSMVAVIIVIAVVVSFLFLRRHQKTLK
jgi:hypothetical protein